MTDRSSPVRPLAVVLVSGGLDSCVTACLAAQDHRLALLHLSYRQRTQERERRAFGAVADRLGADLRLVVDVSYLQQIGGSALTDPSRSVEEGPLLAGRVPDTYVPFRNANLLSIAVAWAESLGGADVYIGVHQEGSTYPDCTPRFVAAFQQTVAAGTRPGTPLRVCAPLLDFDKAEIVRLGARLGAPLQLTWSCYVREDRACGTCQSCRLRLAGFAAAGMVDPVPYCTRV
ncbi:MAG: 7-cyano-7-deazaguanine synthase QueC [Candidatus Latescibacterota bacterium]